MKPPYCESDGGVIVKMKYNSKKKKCLSFVKNTDNYLRSVYHFNAIAPRENRNHMCQYSFIEIKCTNLYHTLLAQTLTSHNNPRWTSLSLTFCVILSYFPAFCVGKNVSNCNEFNLVTKYKCSHTWHKRRMLSTVVGEEGDGPQDNSVGPAVVLMPGLYSIIIM